MQVDGICRRARKAIRSRNAKQKHVLTIESRWYRMRSFVRRWWRRAVATFGNDGESAGGEAAVTDPSTAVSAASTVRSEADLLLEEGVTTEAHILELLDSNGGRLRQKTVVSETGLSKSTVSRTLSDMELGGDIERRRLGRENVVYLPGRDPAERASD